MVEAWYAILCFMLTMFLVLDGWNIGAGMLHFSAAKTRGERRLLIAALGPIWSFHEVWLVAFGGVLFVAFPTILASALAGFYLAIFMVLWSLILRGVSLEVSGHIDDPLWQSSWDFVFVIANWLLALLLGAALGNLVRGVPLDASGTFTLSLFTTFTPYGHVGLLDWYTVSVGLVTMLILSAHGATYLVLKSQGPLHDRSRVLARRLWIAVPFALAVVALETWLVRSEIVVGVFTRPAPWPGLLLAAAGLGLVFRSLRTGADAERRAMIGSSLTVFGLLACVCAAAYPVMLRSTLLPEHSLVAANSAAPAHGLRLAAMWWPFALVLAVVYFAFVARHYRGKVRLSQDTQGFY